MPPDPVLLHALRTAPLPRLREVLQAAAYVLAEAQDWSEIERLVRERLGLVEALRIIERQDDIPAEPGTPAASAPSAPPHPRPGRKGSR